VGTFWQTMTPTAGIALFAVTAARRQLREQPAQSECDTQRKLNTAPSQAGRARPATAAGWRQLRMDPPRGSGAATPQGALRAAAFLADFRPASPPAAI
jgi:hypothetical protein